jgi:Holliday junction resolvasome RuvABC endonuclease subunit
MNKRNNTILAIDPGIRALGFAVLRHGRLATHGVRSLDKVPARIRLTAARRLMDGWIEAYHPTALVLEHTHAHPVPWLNAVDRVARSSRRLAHRKGLVVSSYHPQTVRRIIAGNGHVTKRELAAAVALHYPALRVYLTQDRKWKERYFQNMFDAVALALYHHVRG